MKKYLKRLSKRLAIACLSASLLWGSAGFAALPETIGLGELRPGMQGTGYTVIDESGEIRPFNVEVVGILGDSGKMSTRRILVNLSGPVIDETGGAISGMSGSPIYFNGKLAGALSAGYTDMYPTQRIMLTPIDDMLKIWDYPDTKNQTQLPQLDLKKMRAAKEKFEAEQAAKEAKENGESAASEDAGAGEAAAEAENSADAETAESAEVEEAVETAAQDVAAADSEEQPTAVYKSKAELEAERQAGYEDATATAEEDTGEGSEEKLPFEEKTSYFVSGFGPAGMSYLQERMADTGISFRAMNLENAWDNGRSTMAADYNAVLYPGSPVGVAIAIGDFTMGSLGTVTAVDDKRILAFGHSYTHRGNVNYFMTDAKVITTIHGPTSGMKLGDVNGIIGRINQDRNDCVAGILGKFPQSVPVIVTVHDKTMDRDITYNTMIAYDEEVVELLAPVVVYSAMATTMDRQESATANLKFALRSNYGPNGLIERRNMFYDESDVAKAAVTELNDVLGVIMGNKEREPDILDLKVDVTVESGRKTATLVTAVPEKEEALPGETVNFNVTLRPYRGRNVKVTVPFTVPETQAPGKLALDVHGGGMVNVTKLLLAQEAALAEGANLDEEPPVNAQLQSIVEANRNDEIIIETTVVVPQSDKELQESIKRAKELSDKLAKQGGRKQAAEEPPADKATTDYIIENIIHTSINVVEDK